MARFSLSFLSIFLVLAVLTLSMPTKRDEQAAGHSLSLDGTLTELMQATKLMDGLDNKDSDKKAQDAAASKEEAKAATSAEEAKVAEKLADKSDPASKTTPTGTATKKLASGNFVTPTATPTHKPTSQPNALGKIPIVGGLLGGAGGGL
ncbi:unnamed protein product [Penicillium glandicola]